MLNQAAFKAWIILITTWPLGDVLRKWAGLNQPVYFIHMITPALLLAFLWSRRSLVIEPLILFPCLFISLYSGALAVFYAITDYTFAFLVVWFLSLSALIGPPLLICSALANNISEPNLIYKHTNNCVCLVSLLLLINNLLSIAQSVLGRSHFLSVGAGGAIDSQITTNTAIELRAPGLFTFATGAACFSVVCFIVLLSSIGSHVSKRSALLRLMALITLPIALVRSISRLFLFSLIVIGAPFVRLAMRRSFLLFIAFFGFAFIPLLLFSPALSILVTEGVINFEKRLVDAGGVSHGIIYRFFSTLITDSGGSQHSLLGNIPAWIASDPLGALFGKGLGYSTPLFRFSQGVEDTSYGFLVINGNEILLGETAVTSVLADLGLIGYLSYLVLIFSVLRVYLKKFPLFPFSSSRMHLLSCFIGLILSFTFVYFRPANVMFTSLMMLTPFACSFWVAGHQTVLTSLHRYD